MPVTYNRMGVAAAAAILDLWLEGNMQLTHDEFDKLCSVLVDLLGDARDEVWRLQGRRTGHRTVDDVRDTLPDIEEL